MDDNAHHLAGHRGEEAAALNVLAYLITGPALYGGLGWLLDRWLGTNFFVPIGILVGMAMALYLIMFRYRTPDPANPPTPDGVGRDVE